MTQSTTSPVEWLEGPDGLSFDPNYVAWGTATAKGAKVVEKVLSKKDARAGARDACQARCFKCHQHIGLAEFHEIQPQGGVTRPIHVNCTKSL